MLLARHMIAGLYTHCLVCLRVSVSAKCGGVGVEINLDWLAACAL